MCKDTPGRTLKAALTLCLAVAVCLSAVPLGALAEAVDNMAVIERAVRIELELDDDAPLTWDMLTSVQALTLADQGLTDIASLSMCPNLEVLNISENALQDISALMLMKKLRVLRARDNKIGDISALAGLDQLEEVDLSGNRVTDLSPLRGKTKLHVLALDRNPVTDIAPLGELPRLEKLSLGSTNPSDFSPLLQLGNLEMLNLDHTGIADLSVLGNLAYVESLSLEGNDIRDVSPLSGLTRLKALNLAANANLQDTSALSALTLESYEGPDISEAAVEPEPDLPSASKAVASTADARNGVVRILTTDDLSNPSYFSTGSGFGVGLVGEQTDIFVTNRHVVYDEDAGRIADNIYILLDDDAAKRVYSSFGGFYDGEQGRYFKLRTDEGHMVKCEVLYPSNTDPAYPDLAILRAARPIEGRVALPLLRADEVSDGTNVWTIGYPGSADKLYNLDSTWDEMKYEADADGSQMFAGIISRRGSMKSLGKTMAFTHGAQIDHGNSGGPLVTAEGQVIGINTYGYESAQTASVGYYMSIFIDYAMDKLDELGIGYNLTEPAAQTTGPVATATAAPQPDVPQPDEETEVVSLRMRYVNYTDGQPSSVVVYGYNEYGERTDLICYNSDGSLDHRTEWEFDERGNKVLEGEFDEDNELKYWRQYEYSDENLILSEMCYEPNGDLRYGTEYHYDEGLLYEEVSINVSNESAGAKAYFYNPDGTKRRTEYYDENGNMKSFTECEYDDAGRLTAEIQGNPDGEVYSCYEREYDANGNEVRRAHYETKELTLDYWVENVYDQAGVLLESTLYSKDGSVNTHSVYTYDSYGNTRLMQDYDKDGNLKGLQEYEREYDADGNMLYNISRYNGQVSFEDYYEPTRVLKHAAA